METLTNLIFNSRLLQLLAAGITLLIVMQLIPRLIGMLRINRKSRQLLQRLFPAVEIFAWLLFIFWGMGKLWGDDPFYNTLLAGGFIFLLVLASWATIRDVAAGVVLKAEDGYEAGQKIRLQDLEGRIEHAGYRSLTIESASGELVKIPYSLIAKQSRILSVPKESSGGFAFRVQRANAAPVSELQSELHRQIINTPWASVTKSPQIRVIEETADFAVFEVVVYPIGKENGPKIERMLTEF